MFYEKPLTSFLLILGLAFITIPLSAQVSCYSIYSKQYSSGGKIIPQTVKSLTDGTQIIAGFGNNQPNDPNDGIVMKISGTGGVLWSSAIGSAGDDRFNGICPLDDGGFVVYGHTGSYSNASGNAWLVRITATGTLVWASEFGAVTTAGRHSIKAMKQLAGGDLVGTYNANDSTEASDAIVFKLSITDGTLLWSHKFDNGFNDSFTSIAVSGDTVYTAGFFTAGSKKAVIVQLSEADGALLGSKTIFTQYPEEESFHKEITGLEVYKGIISYGLEVDAKSNTYILLIKTDMAGKPISVKQVPNSYTDASMIPFRTPDNGFFLKTLSNAFYAHSLLKIGPLGNVEWGNQLMTDSYTKKDYALDITQDGGCIVAGYSFPDLSGYNKMNIIRFNSNGYAGDCLTTGNQISTRSANFDELPFSWNQHSLVHPDMQVHSIPGFNTYNTTQTTLCETQVCIDKTPLQPGCGKTYRIEYNAGKNTIFRDMLTTPDGGKIAVGDSYGNGMVAKMKPNGDVDWCKIYDEQDHELKFMRALRSADNNLLLFANNFVTVNHNSSSVVTIIKIDYSGNILWSKNTSESSAKELVDVASTPDGGFITLINNNYGSGGINSYVVRYDANLNIVWQKEMLNSSTVPLYRSVYSSTTSVYLAFDRYEGWTGIKKFGADRLDLATGNPVWSKSFEDVNAAAVGINRVFSINDSVYLFTRNFTKQSSGNDVGRTVLTKLDQQGELIESRYITGDEHLIPDIAYHWDSYPPTVTLTPSGDFVMTGKTVLTGDTALTLTRFTKNYTVRWSKKFPGMSRHSPMNIHHQANGSLIAGFATYSPTDNYSERNGFLLKVDSLGEVLTGGTGDCITVEIPYVSTPVTLIPSYPATEKVIDIGIFSLNPINILKYDVSMDATEYCSTRGNCGVVSYKQRGSGCTVNDTIVYFLENAAHCDAAASWQYDPAFFKAGIVNGDSIELISLKSGISTVNAVIEGNCSIATENIVTTVALSASEVNTGADTSICTGTNLRLSAGPGYTSYKWNTADTDSVITIQAPGKYYVTVTDKCAGSGTDTINVLHADSMFHVRGDTISCNNEMIVLQADKGYSNYQWTSPADLRPKGESAEVKVASTSIVGVSAEKSPGCIVNTSIKITALSSPAINLPGDTSICDGDSLMLDADQSFSQYEWSTGETSRQIYVKEKGEYFIKATFSNGCKSSDTLQLLSIYSNPAPSLNKNPVLCEGSEKTLDAGYGYEQYSWNDGSTKPSLKIRDTGRYWVTVKDRHGCKGTDTTVITTLATAPSHFLPDDTTICKFGKMTIKPTNAYRQYSWSNLAFSSSINTNQPGMYWLDVTDANGCTGRDSIYLATVECTTGFYVPNGFTPNGDGKNDVFKPLIFGNLLSFKLVIFNRWGEKIYESINPEKGWDGKLKNGNAVNDMYIWQCFYQLEGESIKAEKGTVTLIK